MFKKSILFSALLILSCKTAEPSTDHLTTRAEPGLNSPVTKTEYRTIDPSVDVMANARSRAEAIVAKLRTCPVGTPIGMMSMNATICTEKRCNAECCNGCDYTAKFVPVAGDAKVLTSGQLRKIIFDSEEIGMDCQVKAFAEVLKARQFGLVTNAQGEPASICVPPATPAALVNSPLGREAIDAAIQKLPSCLVVKMQGLHFGKLNLEAGMCTKMFCKQACCNGCSWKATFTEADAPPVGILNDSLEKFLVNGDAAPSKDCDIAAWSTALKDYEFGIALPPTGKERSTAPSAQGMCLKSAVR